MGPLRKKAFFYYGVFILCSFSMAEELTTTPLHNFTEFTTQYPDDTTMDISGANILELAKSDSNASREYHEDTPVPSSSEGRLAYLLDHNGVADSMNYFYKMMRSSSTFSRTFNPLTYKDEAGKYLLGDMFISDDQRDFLFGRNSSSTRTRRTATHATAMPWPNGIIKYDFQFGHFTDKEMYDIKSAMEIWQHLTCIKFQLVSRKIREDNYLRIEKSDVFCAAELGWPGARQKSKMQLRGDCLQIGAYLHLLGHVIGLVHEHNLPNRNDYIKVFWGNINANFEEEFKQYDRRVVIPYDNEYDLSSIMHYPVDMFQIEVGALTMMVPDRWMLSHIGNRYRRMLSFSDVKMVNQLYRCGRECEGKVSCPRGGFMNQHCGCYSVDEYYRTYCMNNAAYEAECYKMVIRGECDPTSKKHHKLCSKACGFCPQFLPGQKVQPVSLDVCRDVYHEPMRCAAWAQAGLCAKSIFLKRYCAKSCNVCGHYLSKCPNLAPDKQCDKAAKDGFCRIKLPTGDRARALCQSSCQSCMHVKRGNCKNNVADALCEQRRIKGECDYYPLAMSKECPATCNKCWFNAGECRNHAANNANCEQMAVLNRCTARKYHAEMRIKCKKTCNTCHHLAPYSFY